MDVKADALKEPLIEIDDKADSLGETDDNDCRVVEPDDDVQEVTKPANDKRQVVADKDGDEEEGDGRKVVNGKRDERLQHTSDSELSESDESDGDDASERRKKKDEKEEEKTNQEDEPLEKSSNIFKHILSCPIELLQILYFVFLQRPFPYER